MFKPRTGENWLGRQTATETDRYGWSLPELFHTETYASRGLGSTDWHDHRTGDHAAYTPQNLLDDMEARWSARSPSILRTALR